MSLEDFQYEDHSGAGEEDDYGYINSGVNRFAGESDPYQRDIIVAAQQDAQ